MWGLLVPVGAGAQVPQQSIHPGKSGQELIDALRADYTPSGTLGYNPARDSLYRYLDTRDGVLIGVYGGYSVDIPAGQDPSSTAYQGGSGISAEHTWPQSLGAGSEPQKSDMHHLYPVKQTLNSSRSNHPYDDIPDTATDTWYIDDASQSSIPTSNIDSYSESDGAFPSSSTYSARFEPREVHKGNAARAVFYYYVIYNSTISDPNFFEAQKNELIEWHEADGVDQNEYDRSQWIAGRQGTNNPFVLDTTLVRRAFGTATASPSVTLATTSQSVSEGDGSTTVTVQINNPDGTAVDVDLAFDSALSTATTGDVGNYTTQTVSFPGSAADGDQKTVTVTLTDDSDPETTETANFVLQNVSTTGSTVIGSPAVTERSIADNDGGGGSGTSRLIISQYVDTDSGTEPKGIELWNVSGGTIDFSATPLSVDRYANGSTSPTNEFDLSTGTLGAGEVMVIGSSTLQSYIQANASGVAFYDDPFSHNGNDALEVTLGGTTEDVFGTIGSDPGTAWTGGGVSTADSNIQLLSGITSGTPTGFTDPSTRFEAASASPSDLTGFGEAPAAAVPSVQFTAATQTAAEGDGSTGLVVELLNPDGTAVSVDVAFQSGSSTASASDLDGFSSQTVSFSSSAADGAQQTVSVLITDDTDVEGAEVAQFVLQNLSTSGSAQIGAPGTLDLTIADNEAPATVVVTEIMQNPAQVNDSEGEYFEIYNPGTTALDLSGWALTDAGSDSHIISSLTVPGEHYAVLCRNGDVATNGGVVCDYTYSGLTLANGEDELIVTDDGGGGVDRIEYDGGTNWPDPTGASMTYTGGVGDDNNDPSFWSTATQSFRSGTDAGSPGGPNDGTAFPVSITVDGTGPGWRMFAPPVSGTVVGDLAAQNAVQGISGTPAGPTNLYVAYNGPGASEDPQYWTAPSDITAPLDAGRGFIWYLYDVDDDQGSKALPFPLSYSGTVSSADVPVGIPSTEDWHLLGNPFPFSIPADGLSLGGCQTTVQVYDPAANGYVLVSGATLLAPHQGFFIQCTGSTSSITVPGTIRTNQPAPFYKSTPSAPQGLTLTLTGRTAAGAALTTDAASIRPRPNADRAWDRYDASKLQPLTTPYATLAFAGPDARSTTDAEPHAIRSIPDALEAPLEIPLQIATAGAESVETFTFSASSLNLPDGWTAELVDREGDTIDLSDEKPYTVPAATAGAVDQGVPTPHAEQGRPLNPTAELVGDKATSEARFVLRLTAEPLPVEWAGLTATAQGADVELQWSTASEEANAGFSVEHRADTTAAWTRLGFVEGAGTTPTPQAYRYRVADLPVGTHHFRIVQMDLGGAATVADEVDVQIRLQDPVQISGPFPNPVRGSQTRIQVAVQTEQRVKVEVYDLLGRRLITPIDRRLEPQRIYRFAVPTTRLAPGAYFLRLTGDAFQDTRRMTVVR